MVNILSPAQVPVGPPPPLRIPPIPPRMPEDYDEERQPYIPPSDRPNKRDRTPPPKPH